MDFETSDGYHNVEITEGYPIINGVFLHFSLSTIYQCHAKCVLLKTFTKLHMPIKNLKECFLLINFAKNYLCNLLFSLSITYFHISCF